MNPHKSRSLSSHRRSPKTPPLQKAQGWGTRKFKSGVTRPRRGEDNAEGRTVGGLERRWIVYYAVGQLLRLIYKTTGQDLDADLRRLYKPSEWMDAASNHTKKSLGELFKLSSIAISKAHTQAAKHADFRHRNWFRDSSTLIDISSELHIIPEYRPARDLPLLRVHDGN